MCIGTIRTYLEDGYDVIFNYIISPNVLEQIKEEFKDYIIIFVVLLVDENTLILRDKERPEDCQMNERCIVLLNSFRNNSYNEKNILETSKLNVNETVDIIESNDRFIL